MYDRVVDRAAVGAALKLLVVRDWLLVALAFASGIYEAICFLSFGKVFSAFQTGNIVFLGVIAAGTRPPFGPDPEMVIVSLGAFAAGAALAMPILKRFNGDEEVEDDNVVQVWPRRVSVALGIVLVVQLGFLAVWMTTSPRSDVSYILVSLNAFAMALQMNAIRSLRVPGVSTTAASATFISLVSALATRTLQAPVARRLAGVLASMAGGALVGDWLLTHAHTYAPVLPVLVIAVVVGIATVTFKRAPEGETAPTGIPERASQPQRLRVG